MDINDYRLYLPQYLSDTTQEHLKKELEKFPTDGTKDVIYTSMFGETEDLYQGDGISSLAYINFPDIKVGEVPALLLSNTCDMSTENSRLNMCKILYAPLINYEKYEAFLYAKKIAKGRIEGHLSDIRNQRITQALYLPKGGKLTYDAIVFFDRAISIPLSKEKVLELCDNRMFTLSNFGFYLFLLKLSIHFTRIQEKLDRDSGIDLGQQMDS